MMEKIIEKYGREYAYRQLAEECAELTQALLKLIRAMRKETPMSLEEAFEHVEEEMADVSVMFDGVFNTFDVDRRARIVLIAREKMERMQKRMLGKENA